MKKSVLVVSLAIVGMQFSTQAQKTSFAVSGGISSAFYALDSKANETSDFEIGFTGGISVNIKTGRHWSIQPGFSFVQKGGVEKDNTDGEILTATTTLNYLELPINMVYSKRERFFFGFGAFVGYGLSGKIKLEGAINKKEDVNFGDGVGELKSIDAGLNLLCGFKFERGLFLSLNIASSLNNISNNDAAYFSNAYAGLKFGYIFHNKKNK